MQTSTRVAPDRQAPNAAAPTQPWIRWRPEDGYLTLILLALVTYLTVFSIQNVSPPWAPGLRILTWTTTAGLLFGYVAVQQQRLPDLLVHALAVALGMFFAFTQTADAVLSGDRAALWHRTVSWFQHALLSNGDSSDNTVFLLSLATLTFLLAYVSIWLVLRTRRPWLAVMANAVVLLINLNASTSDKNIFLLLFLLVALLLFVRFTLTENMRRWRARGMRFSPDLSWDFMQAGTIFAVIVLLLAYLLPVGNPNTSIEAALNAPDSPWIALQDRALRLVGGVSGGKGGGGVGFFSTTLRLAGSVDLPSTPILHYVPSSVKDDPTQYLLTENFDLYESATGTWLSSGTQNPNARSVRFDTNQAIPSSTANARTDSYSITFDAVPPGGEQYVFSPGDEPAAFGISTAAQSNGAGQLTQWTALHPIPKGQPYTATGYVATATEAQLRSVPYPAQVSGDQTGIYPSEVLKFDMAGGKIPAAVIRAASAATIGAPTMYEAAQRLEDYLRTFTYSLHTPVPPPGVDPLTNFFETKVGFCTYFASAMAMMGRYLGMPTRIVSGFTNGTYDDKTHSYIVRGTSAHTWTQIYFGTYGWVNFEPTQTFARFGRELPTANGTTGTVPTVDPSGAQGQTQKQRDTLSPNDGTAVAHTTTVNPVLVDAGIGATGALLVALLIAALVSVWWRRLYRGLTPAAAAFARITRLGAWAGAPPLRAQTPIEYADHLGEVVPAQRSALHGLSEQYARERWGGERAATADGAIQGFYEQARRAIMAVIVRRVRQTPTTLLALLRSLSRWRPRSRDRWR